MKPALIISWLIQLATAAILAMAGFMKLASFRETILLFQKIDFDPGGRIAIGLLEILAAILILIPRAAIWGAVLAWGIMTGALIAHCSRLGFTGDFGQLGFMALAIWLGSTLVIVLRRQESTALARMFARSKKNEPPSIP